MALINWNTIYSVGIEEIDQQHKKLIGILNNLFDAMTQGKGSDVIGKIINELFDYSVVHFKTEEKYFEKYEYPETQDHLIEHAKFIDEVSGFIKKFEQKKLSVTIEVMQFLQGWLKEHIMGSDKKYAEFFKEKGDIDKIINC